VQESEAILPAAVAGGTAVKAAAGAAGGGAAVGWALREIEIIGSDDPPDGLTAEALYEETYSTTQTRASTNASSITDNKNIIEGVDHSLWADAKIAAIEELNDQESQDVVLEAGEEALTDYVATIQENLYKTWNESVAELNTYLEAVEEHPDAELTGVFFGGVNMSNCDSSYSIEDFWIELDQDEAELVDGSTMELHRLNGQNDANADGNYSWSPVDLDENDGACAGENSDPEVVTIRTDSEGNTIAENRYLRYADWNEIAEKIEEKYDEIKGELNVWVDGVYGDVQSGELDVDDLLTPREQAELTSEDEDFPQAIADLQALNVGVDLEREAEIYLPDVEATVWGQIAYSGDDKLETGEVDPEDKDGSIYLTYDVSEGAGEWSAHEEGLDGGVLVFTSEPFVDTIYYVDTVAGETVELTADDFEADEDFEEWTVDLSDDLDDAITEVDQIEYYAKTEQTQYETVQLQDTFEIVTFTDSDGEEYDSAEFERSEPHDDDNYISEEEWKEQQERHEELIEKYEDSGGGGIGFLDGEEIPAEGVLLIVLAIFAALFGR